MTSSTPGAAFTVITSQYPETLSKSFERDVDGGLVKTGGGQLSRGRAERREAADHTAFAEVLKRLSPAQALVYGVASEASVAIASRARLERIGHPEGVLTRTRDVFDWPRGPGIMMIDHDVDGDGGLSQKQLVQLLREVAPGLAGAAMLWWPSASSHIHDSRSGEDLTGLRGQRIYMFVADASDIPRAGRALVDRLWAAGHGRIKVSAAGSALERCPVDAQVWQPERLDFAAGAVCAKGLEQRRGEPVLIPGAPVVDTKQALPDLQEVAAAAERLRRAAKVAARPELEAARQAYCEHRADEMLAPEDRSDPEKRKAALAVARRAVENGVLGADWPIEVEMAPGKIERVSVAEILGDRERFHGLRTRDPLEPDYDGGRIVGKLFLLDARPRLFSFARGGRSFRLIRAPHVVEIEAGRTFDAVDTTLELFRHDAGIFDFGGRLALVEDGRLRTLEEPTLTHHLGGQIQFQRRRFRRNGEPYLENVDPPQLLVRQVLGLAGRRSLKMLVAVVTAPTLRPDGSVFDHPGHDAATGLFYDPGIEDAPIVPEEPTLSEAERALDVVMRPFRAFPFVEPLAEGACLSALLTAVLRPCLPTAPAFAVDAPVQGSGKTLLASCFAALATGRPPEVWPHTSGRDDEESRKRLFSALLDGAGAILWDNVVGVLDSPSLAAVLTAPVYKDRVLGRTESPSLPNRALFLITGNNLCLAGDLPRRVITCRIDPETSTPFARRFKLDPLSWVLRHRLDMTVAALTLVRAAWIAGEPKAEGRTASFELWDDLVRQTVCWIDRTIAPGRYGDPMQLIVDAQSGDPEQEALAAMLQALIDVHGTEWFTAKTVQKAAHLAWKDIYGEPNAEKALAEALVDVGTERCLSSSRSLGRVLTFRTDRIVKGLRLRFRSGGKVNEFRVERVEETRDRGFEPDGSQETKEEDHAEKEGRRNCESRSARGADGGGDLEGFA